MNQIDYLYFYRSTETSALIQATSPLQGGGVVEMSKADYLRAVKAKTVELETAAADRADARDARRAALAEKLGIAVEDLRDLR